MKMVLLDGSFSHVTLGLEAGECHDHLLKLMVEDFDWSLLENMNENLKIILTVVFAKIKKLTAIDELLKSD